MKDPELPLDPPEATIRPEPDFERDYTTVDEPEDSFSLDKRLTMMINHVSEHSSFDKRRLIELLKDCQRDIAK